jgi:serine/threonine protein kinase
MQQDSDKTPGASCGDTQSDIALPVLKERYLVQRFIARGGMAMIYRGLDLQRNRTVALKIFHETNNAPSAYAGYLLQEASIISLLHHPHIVQVYDKGRQSLIPSGNEASASTSGVNHVDWQDTISFIVLEFIEGISLSHEIQTRRILPMKRALTIAHAVALALGVVHSYGIVHQDVKPLNIMLGQNGEIKLIDFGIATRYLEAYEGEAVGREIFLGTPQYLAPEQAQGFPVSPATDVYALGVVLFEMLLGRRPFLSEVPEIIAAQHIWKPPPSPRQLNPTIPPTLEAVLLRCLEKEPEKRFQNGYELADALVQLRDAAEDEPALPARRETRGASNYDDDEDLVISSEAVTESSFRIVLQIVVGLCGLIVLIALSIYLTLHPM